MVLTNEHVFGDVTLAMDFARQLGSHARVRAVAQPAAAARLRSGGVATQTLTRDPEQNARRLKRLARRDPPDLLVLLELRNFVDQLRATAPKAPFVQNLRYSALAALGVPIATFDNMPYDGLGREVIERGLPTIVPVPPLDPRRLRSLGAPVHPWRVDRSHAAKRPSRHDGSVILLTLSAWSTELALDNRLGFYYLVLERQLTGALADLRRPVTLHVVGPASRFFAKRKGDVEVRPRSVLSPRAFERMLQDADLLITDHALQHSLVRRVASGRPALLVRQSLTRGGSPRDAEARGLVELWERTTGFWPFDMFPLLRERTLQREPFVRALPKAELFDRGALARAIARGLDRRSISVPLRASIAKATVGRNAVEIVRTIFGQPP
jgi:hypothetical protein